VGDTKRVNQRRTGNTMAKGKKEMASNNLQNSAHIEQQETH
jgi:hypothetical protein